MVSGCTCFRLGTPTNQLDVYDSRFGNFGILVTVNTILLEFLVLLNLGKVSAGDHLNKL